MGEREKREEKEGEREREREGERGERAKRVEDRLKESATS